MQKAVEDQLQYIPSAVAQSALISRLAESGVDLINFESKDIKYKRAGLTIFSSLLDINDDVLPERRMQMGASCFNILGNERQSLEESADVLRMAAEAIGHIAHVATMQELEMVQRDFLSSAVKVDSTSRLPCPYDSPNFPQYRSIGTHRTSSSTLPLPLSSSSSSSSPSSFSSSSSSSFPSLHSIPHNSGSPTPARLTHAASRAR